MVTKILLASTLAITSLVGVPLLTSSAPNSEVEITDNLKNQTNESNHVEQLDDLLVKFETSMQVASEVLEKKEEAKVEERIVSSREEKLLELEELGLSFKETLTTLKLLTQLQGYIQPQQLNSITEMQEENSLTVDGIVSSWNETVASVKKKIAEEEAAAAEKARLEALRAAAAEKARLEALRANAGGGGYVNTTGETPQQRISRIVSGLPFQVAWVYQGCPQIPSALACYTYGDNFVVITPGLMSRSDCFIRYAYAHEYRHYYQYQNGMFQFNSSNQLTNRDALEADANAFASAYRC